MKIEIKLIYNKIICYHSLFYLIIPNSIAHLIKQQMIMCTHVKKKQLLQFNIKYLLINKSKLLLASIGNTA